MAWSNRKSFVAGFVAGMLFKIILIVVIVVIAITWYRDKLVADKAANLQAPKIGETAQAVYDWKLVDENGVERAFTEFQNKSVVLQFWNSECMACEAEIPSMNAMHQATAASGLEIVAIAVDVQPQDLPALASEKRVQYPIYSLSGPVPDVFHYTSGPATFVINPAGMIVLRHIGAAKWDDSAVVAWLNLVGSGATFAH